MVWVYLYNFVSLVRGTFQNPRGKGSSGALPLPTVIIPPLPGYLPSSCLIKPGAWAYLSPGTWAGVFLL